MFKFTCGIVAGLWKIPGGGTLGLKFGGGTAASKTGNVGEVAAGDGAFSSSMSDEFADSD